MATDHQPMLSETARRQLHAERERALKERDHHEKEAKRWDALLSRIDGLLAAANGASRSTPSAETGGPDLWAAIKPVLQENPSGLKPAEVTRQLEAHGFRATGKTSLALLVSNLLWRRAKTGNVERTRKGAYRLVPEAAPKEVVTP